MLCLYGIIDDNVEFLDTLFSSLMLSSIVPNRALFFSKDKLLIDDYTYTFWKTKLERQFDFIMDLIPVHKDFSKANIASLANTMMYRADYAHGLYTIPQVSFERFTIEDLLRHSLRTQKAVEPVLVSARTGSNFYNKKHICVMHPVEKDLGFPKKIEKHEDTFALYHMKGSLKKYEAACSS